MFCLSTAKQTFIFLYKISAVAFFLFSIARIFTAACCIVVVVAAALLVLFLLLVI